LGEEKLTKNSKKFDSTASENSQSQDRREEYIPAFDRDEFPDVASMSVEQLKDECLTWRWLWCQLDHETQKLLRCLGSMIRLVQRDYKGVLGILRCVDFEPKIYEIVVDGREYEYTKGVWMRELKVVRIQAGSVYRWERVLRQEPIEEEATPSQA